MTRILEEMSNVIFFIAVFSFVVAASGIMICWMFMFILIKVWQLFAILINVICVVIDSSAI